MKNEKISKIVTRICCGILFLFMFTIVLRIFTRVIIVERLQVDGNALVNALFFDQPQLLDTENGGMFPQDAPEDELSGGQLDWETLYPFAEDGADAKTPSGISGSVSDWNARLAAIEASIHALTDKVSVYATDYLIGHDYFVGGMNCMEQLVGWNIAHTSEYNAVVTLADGRLTEYVMQCDATENAQSVIELKEFCDELSCEFLYIQSPYAVCKLENADICGTLDFSNANADNLLAQLKAGNVEVLDMRSRLHEDGLSHANAFYRTDHHWKAETGLWAAGNLARYLNETHGYSIDTSMLEPDQFTYEVYPSWFLGSRGTKLSIARVDAEDFTMIYPKYPTLLHYEIPGSRIDETGDFTVTYDWEQQDTTGGYSRDNHYGIYNHGDVAVNILQNKLCPDGKRILIIKDSFTEVVNPFLACADGVSELDVLDVRHFTGSAQAFIREKNPDLVIVWYNPSAIGEIDWTSHKSTFDFR